MTKKEIVLFVGLVLAIGFIGFGHLGDREAVSDQEREIKMLKGLLRADSIQGSIEIAKKDSMIALVRTNIIRDSVIIKVKYVKIRNHILSLSDDSSIQLLSKNLFDIP